MLSVLMASQNALMEVPVVSCLLVNMVAVHYQKQCAVQIIYIVVPMATLVMYPMAPAQEGHQLLPW